MKLDGLVQFHLFQWKKNFETRRLHDLHIALRVWTNFGENCDTGTRYQVSVLIELFYCNCMLQVQRIPDYEKYLSDLLEDTDPQHPDYEDLSKAANRAKTVSQW